MTKRGLSSIIVSLIVLMICSCSSDKKTQTDNQPQKVSERTAESASGSLSGQTVVVSESQEKSGDKSKSRLLPVTKARIVLENHDNMDTLKVVPEASGPGKDNVSFTFEWTKNGESAGTGDSITGFKRGDKISVMVTPYDGMQYGPPSRLNAEIKNSCPKVVEHKEIAFDEKVLTYQVKANDPDGDVVSYSLVDPPKDMTIDKDSGLIKWSVAPDFHGKQEVKVKISDGHGCAVVYPLEMSIASLPEKSSSPKN